MKRKKKMQPFLLKGEKEKFLGVLKEKRNNQNPTLPSSVNPLFKKNETTGYLL